jgi:hypothetical protein
VRKEKEQFVGDVSSGSIPLRYAMLKEYRGLTKMCDFY